MSTGPLLKGECRYIIVGSAGVGKTNLITRFIRDEFVESHNLTLQGEQSVIFVVNQARFRLVFQDNKNSLSMASVKLYDLLQFDGVIFIFAMDHEESFKATQQDLTLFAEQILPEVQREGHKLSKVLVGNKSDVVPDTLELKEFIECERSVQHEGKLSLQERAKRLAFDRAMKFFQLSSKCSAKRQIQNVFVELLNQNDINRFQRREKRRKKGLWSEFLPHCPCDGDDSCTIY